MSSISSLNSSNSLAIISNLLGTSSDIKASVLNLSSGVKTNASVADFSVGRMLASDSDTLTMANINAGQGKSLVSTAKSALDQIMVLLNEQKTLAAKAADASLTDNERANLNLQFQADVTEINRIATTTKFNGKILLDGTTSGVADLTTETEQATENYTLLTTADYSLSGTTAAGNLTTSSVFSPIATNSVGKTAGYATLDFGTVSGAVTNAVVTIGANTVTFSSGAGAAAASAAFVAAANTASATLGNTDIRKFTYVVSGTTVLVTSADLGTGGDTTAFSLTTRGGLDVDTATFGGTGNIDIAGAGASRTIATGTVSVATIGTMRTVDAADITIDANLQGKLTNFTATLDTTGTRNRVTFTADVNGKTYTSQAVTLFGSGGYNSKGVILKATQAITFYNALDDTDSGGDITNNAFKLTVGAADVTITATDADVFQTSLTTLAEGFETQLDANHINQSRSLIFEETNPTNADFTLTSAVDTVFEGIKGFDAVGTNAKGDINFVGDIFGTDGNNSTIGPFAYNVSSHKITTTIDGEVYTADLSTSAATLGAITTEGLANGTGGEFNSATNILTIGSTGTGLVFHSASNTDGKQLRIDLSNAPAGGINLDSVETARAFTDDLDTLFGVSENPSLSFQVGAESTNTLTVALSNAQTTAIYKDDAGAGKTLDISTTAGATEASTVLDNAINNTLSIMATASSAITSFTSAIVTNNVMINNFDAASSVLLNTNYLTESTLYAEATLKYNSGIAVLAQERSRMQNLLSLLSF